MIPKSPRIGFIGFGEVAYHFSKGLKADGIREILAYDKNAREIKKGDGATRAQEAGVQLARAPAACGRIGLDLLSRVGNAA